MLGIINSILLMLIICWLTYREHFYRYYIGFDKTFYEHYVIGVHLMYKTTVYDGGYSAKSIFHIPFRNADAWEERDNIKEKIKEEAYHKLKKV